MQPKFPITVTFYEDGDVWILDSISELACNLEWFNSADPTEQASVLDADNREVFLVVEKLEVKEFKIL